MASRTDAPANADTAPTSDPGIDQGELYLVIRKAVEDAILAAIGTVLLLGVAFVLVWFGFTIVASASGGSLARAAGGAVLIVFGCYLGASELGYVPSVSELV